MGSVNYALEEAAYEQAIIDHSSRTGKDSLFPGPNYLGLVRYLSKRSTTDSVSTQTFVRPPSRSGQAQVALESFLVHNDLAGHETWYQDSHEDKTAFQNLQLPQDGNGQLLFIRGLPSPQWLKTIGVKYGIDPEFYRRHLQFPTDISGDRGQFCSPSLPSASISTFQLRIPTICSRETVPPTIIPEDLEDARKGSLAAMKKYHQGLGKNGTVGDSIVRRYSILSKQFSIIEQQISIHICKLETGWIGQFYEQPHFSNCKSSPLILHLGLIWSDNGRDLSKSVAGPWCPLPGSESWATFYFPVIQAFPKVVDHSRPAESVLSAAETNNPTQTWEAAQNGSLLPFNYGKSLDQHMCKSSALYGLSEVFKFAAFAEVQFCNVMKSRIDHELQFIGYWDRTHSLQNLQHLKTLLGEHISDLAETVAVLGSQAAVDWPDSTDSNRKETVQKVAQLLCLDFKYLKDRAEKLSVACSEGIDAMISASVIAENKEAVRSAESVRKLTVLASLYIPLSFACGFFGMNFKELVGLSIWGWFVMSVMLLLSTWWLYKVNISKLL